MSAHIDIVNHIEGVSCFYSKSEEYLTVASKEISTE